MPASPAREARSLGPCRFCGDPVWAKPGSTNDPIPPAHPCCEIHARENPNQPCIACEASKKARSQRR
ncbi:MAG TPA: hypothetical protein VGV93_09205 [Acidimicrobiales bacterium]|nr:hypothetical protein [Acidimicrobiales bacterium]